MSRLKRFTHSLLSSYAFLGVNLLYTLASVPLALKYLSKAEFGLWALTLQMAGYIALVDLGMGTFVLQANNARGAGMTGWMIFHHVKPAGFGLVTGFFLR